MDERPVPSPPSLIDTRLARRHFERAARGYAAAARLEQEVGERMLARLDYVKLAPRRILDAGAGPAREAHALLRRYPGASLVALDFSLEMLRSATRGRGWLRALFARRPAHGACAELERIPLAGESFDLVWSNMALHWLSEPRAALEELNRVLRPGGLLMLSTLGPDTLKELRAAVPARTHSFLDMHDLGDRILGAGFSAPVVDMEKLTLTYPSADALLDELRASGQSAALARSGRGLGGRGHLQNLRAALAPPSGGRVSATVELVYGHAWKAAPRSAPKGHAKVDLSALMRPPKRAA